MLANEGDLQAAAGSSVYLSVKLWALSEFYLGCLQAQLSYKQFSTHALY